jgi:hypothetical protein
MAGPTAYNTVITLRDIRPSVRPRIDWSDSMRKTFWILGCIAILIIIYFIIDYHQPKGIDLKYNGVIYSNETEFEKQTIVLIKGELYKNLFGNDIFIGVLTTDQDLKYEINLKELDKKYFGLLTSKDNYGFLNSIGSVMTSSNFDKVWIQLDEINEKYDITEGYISGPASTIEEANNIASRILEGHL